MKFKQCYSVYAHDADSRGIMRSGAYTKYMQEAANQQLRYEKPSYYELFDSGLAFILSRMHIKIYKPLRRYDDFESLTWCCPSKGVVFQRCYEIKKDNEVYAQANSAWALIGTADGSIKKVGDYDTGKYSTDEATDTVQSLRFRIPKELPLSLVGKKRVMYSEIDCNMHLNNRFYSDIICDCIDNIENLFVTEISISFVSEAPYGCELEIYRSEPDETGRIYFRTKVGDKTNIEAFVRVMPFDEVTQ